MDFEQQLRLAFAPCDPRPGLRSEILARSSALVKPAGSGRAGKRTILFGAIIAVAAAAAILTASLGKPERIPHAEAQELGAPIPISGDRMAPVAATEEQNPDVTESPNVEVPIPLSEPEKFTVLVKPVDNKGTDAASKAAINAVQAAVISELRSLPGLTLIDAETPGHLQPQTPDYEVRIQGGAGTRGQVYSASIFAYKLGPDGKMRQLAGTVTGGAASCPVNTSSKPVYCDDPASSATRAVNQIRTTLFPFDLTAQRLLQTNLMDASLGFDARLRSLTVLAKRSDIAGSKGALSDPAVVHAAIELATSHADEAQRAHVWRTMRGARHPDLIQPLISAARQGADREVQQEAVVSLGTFVGDARTRDALQTIASADSRPLIRALAQRGLSGESYWNEYVSTSLKDESRTDAERIEAFMYHAIRKGPDIDSVSSTGAQAIRDVLDDGAIEALTVLLPRVHALKGPGGNRTGLVLINVASILDHPAINKMVLDNLTAGTDRALWTSVAEAVVRFRNSDPLLQATLAKITDGDASPETR